jgi:tetratricopeptide (TPR) repeat protein
MTRLQFVTSLCALAGMLFLYGWYLRAYLRRRRLRRQLVAGGRLPDRRVGSGGKLKAWQPVFAVVVPAFAAKWAADTFIAPVFGAAWANVAFGAAVFVLAFVVIFTRSHEKSDTAASDAMRLARGGNTDAATEMLRAAIAAAPSPERRGALGLVFAGAGRWAEAAEAYGDAHRFHPDQPIFTINLAMALSKSGRAGEALPIIEEARRAAPHEAGLAAAECIALAALGRAEEAAEQLRQAKELMEAGPADQRVDMWTLGTLLVECGKAVDAASTRGFPVVLGGATAGEERPPS